MSFLEKLRKGVAGIETEVKKLKELTEESELITSEQLRDNLIKAKTFDSEVRQTYVSIDWPSLKIITNQLIQMTVRSDTTVECHQKFGRSLE